MARGKRYCLQKLVDYHKETGTETWVDTEYCHDKLETLLHFMSGTYRIIDTHNNDKEVKRNFNPNEW